MAAKSKPKKEEPKKEEPKKETSVEEKSVAPEKEEVKESVTKEEVKEMVKKSVDDALKDKPESEKEPEKEEAKSPATEETSVVPSVVEPAVAPPESTPVSTEVKPEESSVIPPATPESVTGEIKPTTPEVLPIVGGDKPEEVGSTPIAGLQQPVSSTTSNVLSTPLSEPEKKKKSPFLLLFLIFVLCGIVIGASIWYLSMNKNVKLPQVPLISSPTPTSAVSVATPTPAKMDLSSYKVSVLNGSGVAGAAASAKVDLLSAGFKDITTGNAPKSVAETTISAKSTVPQNVLEKLSQTLSASYTVSSDVVTLDASDPSDIVVTIGKTK